MNNKNIIFKYKKLISYILSKYIDIFNENNKNNHWENIEHIFKNECVLLLNVVDNLINEKVDCFDLVFTDQHNSILWAIDKTLLMKIRDCYEHIRTTLNVPKAK